MISHDIVKILVSWLCHSKEITFNLEGQGRLNLSLGILVISDLIILILWQLDLLCLQIIKLASRVIKQLFDIHNIESKCSHDIDVCLTLDTAASTLTLLFIIPLQVLLHIKVPHMISIQHWEKGLCLLFECSQLSLVHDGEALHNKAKLLHANLSQVTSEVFTINNFVRYMSYIAGKICRERSSRRGTIFGPYDPRRRSWATSSRIIHWKQRY